MVDPREDAIHVVADEQQNAGTFDLRSADDGHVVLGTEQNTNGRTVTITGVAMTPGVIPDSTKHSMQAAATPSNRRPRIRSYTPPLDSMLSDDASGGLVRFPARYRCRHRNPRLSPPREPITNAESTVNTLRQHASRPDTLSVANEL